MFALLKKFGIAALLLIAIVGMVACAGAATPSAPEEAAPAEEEAAPAEEEAAPAEESKGRIAVILTGPYDDNSWNNAGYDAVMALQEEGYDAVFSEDVADADVERVLRTYADQGYEVIVGHSFSYQDAVFAVAEDYPDINFAWAGGINRTAENVADYDQPFYEAAYAVGVLAGRVSESGKLGALYGFDIPVCRSMGEAIVLGAQTVNPDATITHTAVGDWLDVAKAKEAALAQADAGVDYWVECGEAPALGAIEAAKEAGGYVTGYVGDMTENGPDVVLVSIYWDLVPLFKQMIEDTHNGTFANQYYRFGVAEGAMELVFNNELIAQVPNGEEAKAAAQEVMEQIAAGEVEVPFIPEAQE